MSGQANYYWYYNHYWIKVSSGKYVCWYCNATIDYNNIASSSGYGNLIGYDGIDGGSVNDRSWTNELNNENSYTYNDDYRNNPEYRNEYQNNCNYGCKGAAQNGYKSWACIGNGDPNDYNGVGENTNIPRIVYYVDLYGNDDSNRNCNVDCNGNYYQYSFGNGYRNCNRYSNDRYDNENCNMYSNGWSNIYGNGHRNDNSNEYSYRNSYKNGNRYNNRLINRYGNENADGYSNTNGNRYGSGYGNGYYKGDGYNNWNNDQSEKTPVVYAYWIPPEVDVPTCSDSQFLFYYPALAYCNPQWDNYEWSFTDNEDSDSEDFDNRNQNYF